MAKRVAKGVLKAKMLQYFREVENTKEELIVTSNGIPVIKIIPFEEKNETVDALFADMRGKLRYDGDLTESTESEWEEL